MQTEAPEVFDIRKESEATRARYGDGDFGRGCLMALRLVERGVRMVQVYFGNGQPWDNHDDIQIHRKLAQQADQPIAALLDDLKARGPVRGHAADHQRRVRAHAGGGGERPGEGAERARPQQPRILDLAGRRRREARERSTAPPTISGSRRWTSRCTTTTCTPPFCT